LNEIGSKYKIDNMLKDHGFLSKLISNNMVRLTASCSLIIS
jgi:hypothetical protein